MFGLYWYRGTQVLFLTKITIMCEYDLHHTLRGSMFIKHRGVTTGIQRIVEMTRMGHRLPYGMYVSK